MALSVSLAQAAGAQVLFVGLRDGVCKTCAALVPVLAADLVSDLRLRRFENVFWGTHDGILSEPVPPARGCVALPEA